MPWKEMDAMSLRAEFVALAEQEGSNIRELCRRYRISSRTAYKWLKRHEQEGETGLKNRYSPKQICAEMEAKVLEIREQTG